MQSVKEAKQFNPEELSKKIEELESLKQEAEEVFVRYTLKLSRYKKMLAEYS